MSLVGRRVFAVKPINPVARLSKGVCVCKRVSPSLHSSRKVCGWQLPLTVVRLFQTPTPTKERRKIPFWQVK